MTNKNKILEQNKNKIIIINCVVKDDGVAWPQERKQGRFTCRAKDASPQTRGLNRIEICHHIVFYLLGQSYANKYQRLTTSVLSE